MREQAQTHKQNTFSAKKAHLENLWIAFSNYVCTYVCTCMCMCACTLYIALFQLSKLRFSLIRVKCRGFSCKNSKSCGFGRCVRKSLFLIICF